MSSETMCSIIDALAALPLFAHANKEQRRWLANLCRVRQFNKQAQIFHEGETATGLFVVLEGVAKITRCTEEGREVVLYLVRKGQFMGECGVFPHDTHPADAIAVTSLQALFVPVEALEQFIRNAPETALLLLTSMALRLRMFTHKLKTERQGKAARRLAAYLLHRSQLGGDAGQVTLEVSREVLANLLGLARETLSRQLTRLATSGAIELRGKLVLLRDREQLQRIATHATENSIDE